MVIGLLITFLVLGLILDIIAIGLDDFGVMTAGLISWLLALIMLFVGVFTGFVNHPETEGTHVGVITAVDLEGVYFRRYEVYLKSSGYTAQSDETAYLLYDYEKDLAEELKSYLGKEVKLTYGHDGGYINWKSCGTYHIKSVELIEEGE